MSQTPTPPATERKAPKREHELVKASEWHRITSKYAKASEAERKALNSKIRYEVSVEDLAERVLSLVANEYGPGEDGWHEVHARNGAHWRTLYKWYHKQVMRPQLPKIREVALTCGYDLDFVPRDAEKTFVKSLLRLISEFDTLEDAEIKARLRSIAESRQ